MDANQTSGALTQLKELEILKQAILTTLKFGHEGWGKKKSADQVL